MESSRLNPNGGASLFSQGSGSGSDDDTDFSNPIIVGRQMRALRRQMELMMRQITVENSQALQARGSGQSQAEVEEINAEPSCELGRDRKVEASSLKASSEVLTTDERAQSESDPECSRDSVESEVETGGVAKTICAAEGGMQDVYSKSESESDLISYLDKGLNVSMHSIYEESFNKTLNVMEMKGSKFYPSKFSLFDKTPDEASMSMAAAPACDTGRLSPVSSSSSCSSLVTISSGSTQKTGSGLTIGQLRYSNDILERSRWRGVPRWSYGRGQWFGTEDRAHSRIRGLLRPEFEYFLGFKDPEIKFYPEGRVSPFLVHYLQKNAEAFETFCKGGAVVRDVRYKIFDIKCLNDPERGEIFTLLSGQEIKKGINLEFYARKKQYSVRKLGDLCESGLFGMLLNYLDSILNTAKAKKTGKKLKKLDLCRSKNYNFGLLEKCAKFNLAVRSVNRSCAELFDKKINVFTENEVHILLDDIKNLETEVNDIVSSESRHIGLLPGWRDGDVRKTFHSRVLDLVKDTQETIYTIKQLDSFKGGLSMRLSWLPHYNKFKEVLREIRKLRSSDEE